MKGEIKHTFISEWEKRSLKDLSFEEVDFDKEEWIFAFWNGEWIIGNRLESVMYTVPDFLAKIIERLYWCGVEDMRICVSGLLFGEKAISPKGIKERWYSTAQCCKESENDG